MADKGRVLHQKLLELKCPMNDMSSKVFDYLFDDLESLKFLEYFCQSVDASVNLTYNSELAR